MPFRIRVTLIVLGSFFAALLALPLVWPIAPLEGTVPARDLAPADADWIDVGATELHARIDGPPAAGPSGERPVGVAFVHGFGSTLESFAAMQDQLAQTRTTVSWDRPGFGLTERVLSWVDTNPYSPKAQVAQVLQSLDAAGIERAVLVGHSAGGPIVLRVALEHPERVAGLVLIAPAVYRGGGAPAWSRWLLWTPQLERIGPALMRQLGGESGESLLRSAYADPDRLRPEVLEAYRRGTRVEHWDRGLWELVKASREPDVKDRLAEVSVPVLVVSGAEDVIVPLEQTQRTASELPNAELLEIPACGHVPQEECPEPLVRRLEAWWAEQIAP